jgi:hypothetical protein
MIRQAIRAVLIIAAVAVVMRLSPKAAWLDAGPRDDSRAAAAEQGLPEVAADDAPAADAPAVGAAAADEPKPSDKAVKGGRDRFAKAVRAAFALPKGFSYSQLSRPQQKKWDDLRTKMGPKLREALQAVQDNTGDKEAEAKRALDGVHKEIRAAIDQIVASSGGGQETPSSSGSDYPSSSAPPPYHPEQGNYYPPYPGYPVYWYGGPGGYYPGYGYPYSSWDHRRTSVTQTTLPKTTSQPANTTPKPPPKPKPTPKPAPKPPPKPTPKP